MSIYNLDNRIFLSLNINGLTGTVIYTNFAPHYEAEALPVILIFKTVTQQYSDTNFQATQNSY